MMFLINRLCFWLIVMSCGYTVIWFTLGIHGARKQGDLDNRCNEIAILDESWPELSTTGASHPCEKAASNKSATAIFFFLAVVSIIVTLVSLLVSRTRSHNKLRRWLLAHRPSWPIGCNHRWSSPRCLGRFLFCRCCQPCGCACDLSPAHIARP